MAVADSVENGTISKDIVEDTCILCGVFIHPAARDPTKFPQYNYEATELAIKRAFNKEPTVDEIISKKDSAGHPFYR